MKTDGNDLDRSEVLEAALKEFRSSALAATQRPESFWAAQRRAVLDGVGRRKTFSRRFTLAWVVAAALVVIVAGVLLRQPRSLPAPDFAAGYDRDLLIVVEQMIDAQEPLALDPAMLIAEEIEADTIKHKGP